MIQVKKSEITLMNKTNHYVFEKARTTRALLVLKTDLKYVSVKKKIACLV